MSVCEGAHIIGRCQLNMVVRAGGLVWSEWDSAMHWKDFVGLCDGMKVGASWVTSISFLLFELTYSNCFAVSCGSFGEVMVIA